jgi:hypothetical protein
LRSRAVGRFIADAAAGLSRIPFANIVSVTFSAFDPFQPIDPAENKGREVKYTYVGLKGDIPKDDPFASPPNKTTEDLNGDFAESLRSCAREPKLSRWRRALNVLEVDPIFADAGFAEFVEEDLDKPRIAEVKRRFGRLSSGHKIVLLTITRLVESVEERSLVLLDEPEAHLHPPLLSAFVRALSDLLVNRNGVAIVATHSPVILQEVPKSCVWFLRRSGNVLVSERPQVETFGENVGVLTSEVFGLEVTNSGFHRMITDAIEEGADTYDGLVELFDCRLGGEARGIARALIATEQLGDVG